MEGAVTYPRGDSQDLERIQQSLNSRPSETFEFMTPSEKLDVLTGCVRLRKLRFQSVVN